MLLHAQGLMDDPAAQRPATPRGVARLVEKMGFVQVDTISTVERAHHLILAARMNGYRPAMLAHALERDRLLFEHWTHDASVIPLKWYPHWRPRFERARAKLDGWHRRQLGEDADRLVAAVLERIRREGPLSSLDFEHDGPWGGPRGDTSWWGWKPAKLALDYLWRVGELHVAGRRSFQKVYDLPERVIPGHAPLPPPDEAGHVEWASRTALERLGTATAREVAQFWAAVPIKQATTWLAGAAAAGEVVPVLIESADDSPPRRAYALPDFGARIRSLRDPPPGVRLLCPFDPVLRDRARAKRLFGFDFRFEGFVPAAQRKHGYYVMAILEGERFVGKLDPKFDRATGTLRVRKVWWGEGVKVTRARASGLRDGIEKLARWVGAGAVALEA